MKLLRAGLVMVALALLVPHLGAQADAVFPIVADFDADSTTMTYVLFDQPRSGNANLKTSGSSATVTAASGTPFDAVAVGDEIFVRDGPTDGLVRYVRDKASGASITVNSAVNWSANGATGFGFSYRTLRTGTGDTAGWFNVSRWKRRKEVWFGVEQLVATGGVLFQVDCITGAPAAKPTKVYPQGSTAGCDNGTFTAAGAASRCVVVMDLDATRCRFGVKIVTADDGDDLTTNREDIHAEFHGVE